MALSAREFSRRISALGLTSTALPAARKVLVEGRGYNSVARSHGVDPALLFRLCATIRLAEICRTCGQPIRRRRK